jgi:hypothetical protein
MASSTSCVRSSARPPHSWGWHRGADLLSDDLEVLGAHGWVETIAMRDVLAEGFEALRAGRKMKVLVDPTR